MDILAALRGGLILTPFEVTVLSADGAKTNLAISPAIATNRRLAVVDLYVTASAANTVSPAVRIGFGAATLPAAALAGVAGIIGSHPGLTAGSGFYGIPGIGEPGEELRLTCGAPTTGALVINYLYAIVRQ